jgi:hypothetical protein
MATFNQNTEGNEFLAGTDQAIAVSGRRVQNSIDDNWNTSRRFGHACRHLDLNILDHPEQIINSLGIRVARL